MPAKIKNNHNGKLNIAGKDANPGATISVDSDAFKFWKNGNAAKKWLEMKLIEVVGANAEETEGNDPTVETEPPKESDPAVFDRSAALTEARSLGLNPNGNISDDNLAKLIADKKAK